MSGGKGMAENVHWSRVWLGDTSTGNRSGSSDDGNTLGVEVSGGGVSRRGELSGTSAEDDDTPLIVSTLLPFD
jgi:hypothetical protein